MEIRNTPTEPDLEWLDSPELLSQLMIALRNVGVHEVHLPCPSDTMVDWIGVVQRIHHLLVQRAIDPTADLQKLSEQTGWLIQPLLEECLQWPKVTPHVREKDGIRRLQRCWLCCQREYPDAAAETLCDGCLLQMIDLLRTRKPPEGFIFFRTYNQSHWCPHADSETVLMTSDDYDFLADGRCELCLREEYERRRRS